jgi:hypothetical protein
MRTRTPEQVAAHDALTAAVEAVLRADGHGADIGGDLVAMDYAVVVWSKNMTLVEGNRSCYSYLVKDGVDGGAIHQTQGLARRLVQWADQDDADA